MALRIQKEAKPHAGHQHRSLLCHSARHQLISFTAIALRSDAAWSARNLLSSLTPSGWHSVLFPGTETVQSELTHCHTRDLLSGGPTWWGVWRLQVLFCSAAGKPGLTRTGDQTLHVIVHTSLQLKSLHHHRPTMGQGRHAHAALRVFASLQ